MAVEMGEQLVDLKVLQQAEDLAFQWAEQRALKWDVWMVAKWACLLDVLKAELTVEHLDVKTVDAKASQWVVWMDVARVAK